MKEKILLEKCDNVYCFGSTVYGTNSTNSDEDFICISNELDDCQISIGNKDYNVYSVENFQKKLDKNDIDALECMFLDDKYIVKENIKFEFKIDISCLKDSVGKLSSNSYVKCHKKLTVEKDFNPYTAKKSLWHAFRVLMYGIQIAKTQKIYDYACANNLYDVIMKMPDDWNLIKTKFQPEFNKLKSQWRMAVKQEET